jgi:hypothetical protein
MEQKEVAVNTTTTRSTYPVAAGPAGYVLHAVSVGLKVRKMKPKPAGSVTASYGCDDSPGTMYWWDLKMNVNERCKITFWTVMDKPYPLGSTPLFCLIRCGRIRRIYAESTFFFPPNVYMSSCAQRTKKKQDYILPLFSQHPFTHAQVLAKV